MKKIFLNSIFPVCLGVILLGMTLFAISSCEAYYDLDCEVVCDDDHPYWGGDNTCYPTQDECEQFWDECIDCTK